MIITIDGPAGTGKTTVARKTAEKLGYSYFDTGAMYRAVTYGVVQEKIDLSDHSKLKTFLDQFRFEIHLEDSVVRYFVCGSDVTDLIRSSDVTKRVSEVSARQEVREKLVALQRELSKGKKAVFEGRDMGTVVFPKAELKIYLTARPAVRAERRYLELKAKSKVVEEKTVLDEILERDHYDSTREISPLAQPKDAHLIDTSDLSTDDVVNQIVDLAKKLAVKKVR